MIVIQALLLLLVLTVAMAIPVMFIVKAWIVDATLDAGMAIGTLLALFILVAFTFQSQGTVWMYVGIVALVGCAIGIPLLAGQSDQGELKRQRDEDIQKYQSAIAFDPRNASAHAFLAARYVECGRYAEAIAEYQQALGYLPDGPSSGKWKRQLRDVMELQQGQPKPQLTVCDTCQVDLPVGTKSCPHCGAIQEMSFVQWFSQPENFKSIIQHTAMAMLLTAVLFSIFSALPLEVKACVLVASAIVGAFYFLRSIDGSRD